MKLLEININNGHRETSNVAECIESPEHLNLVVDAVYSRGLGIQHFLVDDNDKQTRIELQTECPVQPPYVAIGTYY